jgi:hypothetical protein
MTGISVFLVFISFFLRWFRQRTNYNRRLLAVVAVVASFQCWTTLVAGRRVPDFSLRLGSVISALVIRPAATVLLGEKRIGALYESHSGQRIVIVAGLVVLASAAFALRCLDATARVALVSVVVVNTVLVTVSFGGDLTDATKTTRHGRYLVIPVAALYLILLAGASRLLRGRIAIAAVGLACLAFPTTASLSDWAMRPYPTIDWPASARCIAEHRECTVPLNPTGWSAMLPPLPNVR